MPATRKPRTSTGPVGKGTQKTLAFNNTKISKPSENKAFQKTFTPPPAQPLDLEPVEIEESKPIVETPVAAVAKPKTAEEIKAAKVSDAQIKKYWRAREEERISARVHQEGLTVEEKILRLFDMSSQFGPCIGTPRMKRWVRANRLGLSPPIEVLAVLMKEEEKGNTRIERAYVDELLSSKQVD